jgi:hypothetical protein
MWLLKTWTADNATLLVGSAAEFLADLRSVLVEVRHFAGASGVGMNR